MTANKISRPKFSFAQVAVRGKCPAGMEGSPFGDEFPADSAEDAITKAGERAAAEEGVVAVEVENYGVEGDDHIAFVTGLDANHDPVIGFATFVNL